MESFANQVEQYGKTINIVLSGILDDITDDKLEDAVSAIQADVLCKSLFFNKAAGSSYGNQSTDLQSKSMDWCLYDKPATLFKKRLAKVFSCEFCQISMNTFSYGTSPVAASELLKY